MIGMGKELEPMEEGQTGPVTLRESHQQIVQDRLGKRLAIAGFIGCLSGFGGTILGGAFQLLVGGQTDYKALIFGVGVGGVVALRIHHIELHQINT